MIWPATLLVLLFWLVPQGAGAACPEAGATPAERYRFKGRDLWSPERIGVAAGGDIALAGCAGMGLGHVRQAPDVVLDLTRMRRFRRLHLRSFAECDTVLLLRDPSGRWFFDDDSGVGKTASLSIANPVDGEYAVWVGSYDAKGCLAELTLETF